MWINVPIQVRTCCLCLYGILNLVPDINMAPIQFVSKILMGGIYKVIPVVREFIRNPIITFLFEYSVTHH